MNPRDPPVSISPVQGLQAQTSSFFFLTYRVSEARHLKKLHPVPFPLLPRRLRTPWGQITYFTFFYDSEVRGSAQCRLIRVPSGFVNPSLPTLRPALLPTGFLQHLLNLPPCCSGKLCYWKWRLGRGTHQGSFQACGIVVSPSHHQE